ncbi:MAG: hypothetical protein AB7H97_21285 [Pseudobdellovibrionaceae bacterium]
MVALFIFLLSLTAGAKNSDVSSCELMVGTPPHRSLFYSPIDFAASLLFKNPLVKEVVGFARHFDQGSNERAIAVSADGRYFAFGMRDGGPPPERHFDELAKFDAFAAQLGMKIPEKTGILVSSKSGRPAIFPRVPGAFFEQGMTWIDLRTDFRNIRYAYSIPVMNHERTHLLLRNTFGRNAFVILNIQVQEAFCDFLPALFHGIPPEDLMPDFKTSRWKDFPADGGAYTQLLPNILWQIFRQVETADRPRFFVAFVNGLQERYETVGLGHFLSVDEDNAELLMDQRDRAAKLMLDVARNLRPYLELSAISAPGSVSS